MTEEENTGVAVAEATESVPEAAESEKEPELAASPEEARRRNDQEFNWAETRKRMQELDRQNREMQEQLKSLSSPKAAPEDDEIDKMSDDDIMTKRQARKMAERMAQQVAERVIKQREAATVDERLQLKFSDFGDVVTRDNIELLKQHEPELAQTLYHNPDPFGQGVAAYKLIKKLGYGSEAVAKQNLDKDRAVKNSQKPVSVNAVTKQSSAIGNAHLFENGLTDELKASLLKEMRDCAKRA